MAVLYSTPGLIVIFPLPDVLPIATIKSSIKNALIDLKQAIATIPSLAIHLDREANKQRTVNAQLHLPPVWFQTKGKIIDFRDLFKRLLKKKKLVTDIAQILDFELYYYDTQSPAIIGLNNEFIASAQIRQFIKLLCWVESTNDDTKI